MQRILIVDDDRDLLEGQKIFLESKGYQVDIAGSMKEGLERLKGFRPDLILADLMMEHYDTGFVFSKKVRGMPELARVPILIQTSAPKEIGFDLDSYTEKAKGWMKVDEVMIKPVALDELAGKIERYLSRPGK